MQRLAGLESQLVEVTCDAAVVAAASPRPHPTCAAAAAALAAGAQPMELTFKLLAALPARAEGLGATTSTSIFRPKFSVQCTVLGPDGFSRSQTSKEISLSKGGGGGGGASGASRPQPLGHQTLTFTLPSAQRGSSHCNSCSSSGGHSRVGSPAGSFTTGCGGCGCCERCAAQRAATELRFGVLGKLSDMTTGVRRA